MDCGGYTTDIECLRIDKNGELSETHHGAGITVGGLNIDHTFIATLKDMLGTKFISDSQKKFTFSQKI